MNIQKLPWAGVRIQSGETSVVIDPLYHLPANFGQSHEPLLPLDEFGRVDAVLLTHHHGDHFDPEAIAKFYGSDIPVYLPLESMKFASESGLSHLRGVALGETAEIGSLTATATYSVDGIGDPQVSWVVTDGEKKLIHCGDTLWHGYWWKIKQAYGPFDVACLPVNGAVVEIPGLTPSGLPITLVPEQAVAASLVLEAEYLMPIHYKAIHHPPHYRQTPDLLDRLCASAQNKVKLAILNTKELLVW